MTLEEADAILDKHKLYLKTGKTMSDTETNEVFSLFNKTVADDIEAIEKVIQQDKANQ